MYTGKYYYDDEQFKLIKGDTFKVLKKFEDKTIDTILFYQFTKQKERHHISYQMMG